MRISDANHTLKPKGREGYKQGRNELKFAG